MHIRYERHPVIYETSAEVHTIVQSICLYFNKNNTHKIITHVNANLRMIRLMLCNALDNFNVKCFASPKPNGRRKKIKITNNNIWFSLAQTFLFHCYIVYLCSWAYLLCWFCWWLLLLLFWKLRFENAIQFVKFFHFESTTGHSIEMVVAQRTSTITTPMGKKHMRENWIMKFIPISFVMQLTVQQTVAQTNHNDCPFTVYFHELCSDCDGNRVKWDRERERQRGSWNQCTKTSIANSLDKRPTIFKPTT